MAEQTPWHVGSTEDPPSVYLWDAADVNLMASVDQEPSERWTTTIARAHHIVLCVNNHAALLAAARLALDAVGWPISSKRCQEAQAACNAAVKAAEGREGR